MFTDLIDTRQGTDSTPDYSTGNTLPLATWPNGAIGWSPQTATGRWFYDRRSPKLQGFRATRQPSPWIGDYGEFLIFAAAGESPPVRPEAFESSFAREQMTAQPHYFSTLLLRHEIQAEITPTEHGACFRFTFRKPGAVWLALQPGRGAVLPPDAGSRRWSGYSSSNQGGVPRNFRAWFVAEASTRVRASGVFSGPSPDGANRASPGRWLKLERPRGGVVELRVATSLISSGQAGINFDRELGSASFASLRARARRAWEQALGVVRIEGADRSERETFYRCLYRCRLFPRRIDECDAAGQRVHYSPFDGRVHAGPMYTDFGFWDGYRAHFPLLALTAPDLLGDMIAGWLNAYREGGWLPSWVSPGYRSCMVGSHGAAVIADAWLKGVRGFDPAVALEAMLKDATVDPQTGQYGRLGLSAYRRFGYVPADVCEHSVARTQDYAHCDYAIDRFARALGRGAETERLAQGALNYRHLFDQRRGFFRGRNRDGSWIEPFSPLAWAGEYIEGNAWQYAWGAPHDPAGLIRLHGGEDNFVRRLETLLTQEPKFETGHYGREIHEMTEMAAVPFGQYAHCNEPVHHLLQLFACAGRPDRTQHWVRRVMDELYTPDAYPGDEDNGAMSAWYVFSALGLFPLTCGHPGYILGAPRFPAAVLAAAGRPEFLIEARAGGKSLPPYVRAVHLNGRKHAGLEIGHRALAAGGSLRFQLTGDARKARVRGAGPRPFSFSDSMAGA